MDPISNIDFSIRSRRYKNYGQMHLKDICNFAIDFEIFVPKFRTFVLDNIMRTFLWKTPKMNSSTPKKPWQAHFERYSIFVIANPRHTRHSHSPASNYYFPNERLPIRQFANDDVQRRQTKRVNGRNKRKPNSNAMTKWNHLFVPKIRVQSAS